MATNAGRPLYDVTAFPPAVSRIFERLERIEPLLAHRPLKHTGPKHVSRLEPLLATQDFATSYGAEETFHYSDKRSRSLSQRKGSRRQPKARHHFISPPPSYNNSAEFRLASEHSASTPLSMTVVTPPPLHSSSRAYPPKPSYMPAATELASSVYGAPVVPGMSKRNNGSRSARGRRPLPSLSRSAEMPAAPSGPPVVPAAEQPQWPPEEGFSSYYKHNFMPAPTLFLQTLLPSFVTMDIPATASTNRSTSTAEHNAAKPSHNPKRAVRSRSPSKDRTHRTGAKAASSASSSTKPEMLVEFSKAYYLRHCQYPSTFFEKLYDSFPRAESTSSTASQQMLQRPPEKLVTLVVQRAISKAAPVVRPSKELVRSATYSLLFGAARGLGQVCPCGNIFMADSSFCRKCGSKREVTFGTLDEVAELSASYHAEQQLLKALCILPSHPPTPPTPEFHRHSVDSWQSHHSNAANYAGSHRDSVASSVDGMPAGELRPESVASEAILSGDHDLEVVNEFQASQLLDDVLDSAFEDVAEKAVVSERPSPHLLRSVIRQLCFGAAYRLGAMTNFDMGEVLDKVRTEEETKWREAVANAEKRFQSEAEAERQAREDAQRQTAELESQLYMEQDAMRTLTKNFPLSQAAKPELTRIVATPPHIKSERERTRQEIQNLKKENEELRALLSMQDRAPLRQAAHPEPAKGTEPPAQKRELPEPAQTPAPPPQKPEPAATVVDSEPVKSQELQRQYREAAIEEQRLQRPVPVELQSETHQEKPTASTFSSEGSNVYEQQRARRLKQAYDQLEEIRARRAQQEQERLEDGYLESHQGDYLKQVEEALVEAKLNDGKLQEAQEEMNLIQARRLQEQNALAVARRSNASAVGTSDNMQSLKVVGLWHAASDLIVSKPAAAAALAMVAADVARDMPGSTPVREAWLQALPQLALAAAKAGSAAAGGLTEAAIGASMAVSTESEQVSSTSKQVESVVASPSVAAAPLAPVAPAAPMPAGRRVRPGSSLSQAFSHTSGDAEAQETEAGATPSQSSAANRIAIAQRLAHAADAVAHSNAGAAGGLAVAAAGAASVLAQATSSNKFHMAEELARAAVESATTNPATAACLAQASAGVTARESDAALNQSPSSKRRLIAQQVARAAASSPNPAASAGLALAATEGATAAEPDSPRVVAVQGFARAVASSPDRSGKSVGFAEAAVGIATSIAA